MWQVSRCPDCGLNFCRCGLRAFAVGFEDGSRATVQADDVCDAIRDAQQLTSSPVETVTPEESP